jgi:hypothetical protein
LDYGYAHRCGNFLKCICNGLTGNLIVAGITSWHPISQNPDWFYRKWCIALNRKQDLKKVCVRIKLQVGCAKQLHDTRLYTEIAVGENN